VTGLEVAALDEFDTSAAVEAMFARAMQSWKPPARMALSAWADQHYYLSAESAAEPGRWHTLPYQRGFMDAFTDPEVTQVTLMKSARVGWTKCLNAVIGYYMHQDPCPLMLVQPTIDDAEGYSKEEIAPMLRDCPTLAAIVPPAKTRDTDNTILAKRFRGGSLSMVGANSPRGFRRVSRKVVLFDETDGYPPSAGSEGDQIQLGIRRTEYYWDRKIGAGSTPTIAGHSRIEALFYAGDQRRYYVPCPDCGFMQVLQFKQFRWPSGQPERATYVCIGCGVEIDARQKQEMVGAGEWRPGPHPQFPDDPPPAPFAGHASFHIWAAYSYSPNATWGQLCTEFAKANKEGPEHLKTYVNTVLGEPWRERGEAPEWKRLYDRRESYPLGTCPEGVLFLTAGVDVQKDRLVYEVVGWGRGKRSWSIEIGVLPGETSDITSNGPWPKLAALLDRAYPRATGGEQTITMLAVDSGFNTQVVYNWARGFPMSRVIAVRGVHTAHVLISTPSRVDISIGGKKLKRGYKVWPVASHVAKAELYGWLALQAPTDEARAEGADDPPGFCHFPEHGEDYFKQLTAEQLISTKTRKGTVFSWEVIPGRENHYLDARVYARAAASVAGIDRFKDADWAAIEKSHGVKPPAAPQGGPTTPPPPAPPPPSPGAAAPSSWLRRPTGGWFDRGRR
jgi:phage terminase large subunit GpA-like protein